MADSSNLGAVEQGLGLLPIKVGSGEKEAGYAIGKSRFRTLCSALCFVLVLLTLLAGVYAWMYDNERFRRVFDKKASDEKMTDLTANFMKQQMALQQQNSASGKEVDGAERALHRISNSIKLKFDEFMAYTPSGEFTHAKVGEFRDVVVQFVDGEVKLFEKEALEAHAKANAQMAKVNKFQEKSLRDLISSVSDVKLEAFEELLKDIFEEAKKAKKVDVTLEESEKLEDIADALYEGKLTGLKLALIKVEKIRLGRNWGDLSLLENAKDELHLAQEIELLCDDASLSRGRKEIAAIEAKYRAELKTAHAEKDLSDIEDMEVEANVEAVMAIQRLVAQGKVPLHLMDFEDIELDGEEDDDEDDDDVEPKDLTIKG